MVNNTSLNFSQQVLDLFLAQHLEALAQLVFFDDSNFNVLVSHLTLERVLKSFDGSVHCITDIDVIRVSLLKERAGLFGTLTECGGFPAVVSS